MASMSQAYACLKDVSMWFPPSFPFASVTKVVIGFASFPSSSSSSSSLCCQCLSALDLFLILGYISIFDSKRNFS